MTYNIFFFFFSSRRRHTRSLRDWSSDVCSSDLGDLASRGGKVFVACRSADKGRATAAEITAATGNDAVVFLPLDLADLASVRRCAAEFLDRGEPLHVLINNAGVGGARGLTRDGFELGFGINHLGHFALTTALLG